MTREQIRATIEGLERIARGECHSGNRREIAHDALTLLREAAEDGLTERRLLEVLNEIDSERKAVGS